MKTVTHTQIPLPDKPIHKLNKKEMKIFRQWMGLDPGGPVIAYPSEEEIKHRNKRERWKKRFAGKGKSEPSLLIRKEQIQHMRANIKKHSAAKKWCQDILQRANEVIDLPTDFFDTFIPDTGLWNRGGNFCPNCVHKKSPEGINRYFWQWDWKSPDTLTCPYCHITYPHANYPENGILELPRLQKTYTFHILKEELETKDWRLGDNAGKFVNQPIHVSFTGNIRALKIQWAIVRTVDLSLAYAFTGKKTYIKPLEKILQRFAQVYSGYLLHSYFQDTVDADPGYATDHADALPTVFKRNASISVYDGRHGYNHEKTTTRFTRVATGLWGCSRIATELSTTGGAFLKLFQAYDLVKKHITQKSRQKIEQDFLLELFLDVKAYEPLSNKAGPVRASRVAFGLVYNNKTELNAGLKGYHKILEGQFHPDGSMKESPIYGHKPIGEDLWRIPEMMRGTQDLYANSLLEKAFQAFTDITTPEGKYPPLDDSYVYSGTPTRTFDIAAKRCQILIPGDGGAPPSDFAILNTDLSNRPKRPSSGKAFNHYYEGRHLACVGFGSGAKHTQLYFLGEDGHRGHRHAGPLTLQLFANGREIFPDLGYICDHPGNQWVKATASHQTITIDGQNLYPGTASSLLGFATKVSAHFVDMHLQHTNGTSLRRAITLLRKPDGLPILIDLFDVEGASFHDYNTRIIAPPKSLKIEPELQPRKNSLYQNHSFYPLKDFQTAGKTDGGWKATWGRGQEKVQAHILTASTEVITYRSPGWRSQMEITSEPNKYLDTLVLRNRKKHSRFVVVYEIIKGQSQLRRATLNTSGEHPTITLSLTKNKTTIITMPNHIQQHSETLWQVK
jgi:ribosomal protein L37AE/L43A